MSSSILILGDSGTGKSTAIRTLPPEETFIISVIGKQLPFRGAAINYKKLSPDGLTGNFYCTDDGEKIQRILKLINNKRPEIKYLVMDDLGYVLMNGFMKRALIKGYDRFSEIASDFNKAIESINDLRDDLFIIVTMHIETDRQGKTKPKTVGNMVDQYVCIEGKFTCVFHSIVIENNYKFITNNDGIHMAKTPLGMFDQKLIDNDMLSIVEQINAFNVSPEEDIAL